MELDKKRESYARVTQILSPWVDFSFIDPQVLQNAADRGTRVHAYCYEYADLLELHACDMFDFHSVDEDCKPYVESFALWFNDNVAEVAFQEQRLYCDEYQFCGQPDAILRLKNEEFFTVLDNKTPQTKQRSWDLQTAAYKYLATKCHPNLDIQRRASLSLKKTGKIAKMNEYTDENSEDLFLNACKLYYYFNVEGKNARK